MGVNFKAALREYRWLTAAYAQLNAICDRGDKPTEAGWQKFWDGMDRFDFAERLSRKGGATGCIHGSKCPVDGPVTCLHCAGMVEVEAAA